MQILKVNNTEWMVGLEWEILPGDSTIKAESKEVAEKTGLPYGIVVEYDNTYAIGLTKKAKTNIKPAAVYLAAANQVYRESQEFVDYPDWIVIEEANDDRYWMSVIKSGIPAPQFDAILSITEIKERINELLINDTYLVYSQSQEIINIFDGIKEIIPRDLNDLTSDISIKIKFSKLTGIPTSVLIVSGIATIGFVVLSSIFYMLDGISSREKAESLQRKMVEEQEQRKKAYENAKKDYEVSLNNARQSKVNEVILGLSGNPTEILNAYYKNVGNTDVGTHGWSLTDIECYFNVNPITQTGQRSEVPEAYCDYLYKRNPLATTRMFLQDYPTATLNGDIAKVKKVVEINPIYISKAPESVLTTIKPSKVWGFNVLSQLQLLKVADIDSSIGASSEISFIAPPEPLTPEQQSSGAPPNQPKTVNLGIGTGEVTVKGSNFDLVKELADNVDFSSTNLKKIKFKVSGTELSWEAVFAYYISTIDGDGVGASSIKSDNDDKTDKK